jgi:hypothetical protein
MSVSGTFRTQRDVRLESVMRSRADVRAARTTIGSCGPTARAVALTYYTTVLGCWLVCGLAGLARVAIPPLLTTI